MTYNVSSGTLNSSIPYHFWPKIIAKAEFVKGQGKPYLITAASVISELLYINMYRQTDDRQTQNHMEEGMDRWTDGKTELSITPLLHSVVLGVTIMPATSAS